MNTSSRLNRSCCSIVIAISILITLLNFATNLFVIVGRKVFSAESAPRSLCFNNKMFNDTFFRTMDALFGRKTCTIAFLLFQIFWFKNGSHCYCVSTPDRANCLFFQQNVYSSADNRVDKAVAGALLLSESIS
jgi:hypothetical protein